MAKNEEVLKVEGTKLESRLPQRVPDEKRAAIADRVVAKMRQRGALRDTLPSVAVGQLESVLVAAPMGSAIR